MAIVAFEKAFEGRDELTLHAYLGSYLHWNCFKKIAEQGSRAQLFALDLGAVVQWFVENITQTLSITYIFEKSALEGKVVLPCSSVQIDDSKVQWVESC